MIVPLVEPGTALVLQMLGIMPRPHVILTLDSIEQSCSFFPDLFLFLHSVLLLLFYQFFIGKFMFVNFDIDSMIFFFLFVIVDVDVDGGHPILGIKIGVAETVVVVTCFEGIFGLGVSVADGFDSVEVLGLLVDVQGVGLVVQDGGVLHSF